LWTRIQPGLWIRNQDFIQGQENEENKGKKINFFHFIHFVLYTVPTRAKLINRNFSITAHNSAVLATFYDSVLL
jgi:hypothetical protein